MRKRILLWCLLLPFLVNAQQRDTVFYRSQAIPVHLQPIERAAGSSAFGSVYYYGGKRLSSPNSLEIPFYELSHPTVNRHYRNFRLATTVSRVIAIAPFLYFLTQRSGVRFNSREYWTIYIGSVAASLGVSIYGNSQVNKAVKQYNTVLREARVGVSLQQLPGTSQPVMGVGIRGKF
ncbi:hypothetical protein [Arsenicibacter rosenii]|uniref:DUF5683 domain-containing protein n=1 Tax=Arsenicibacter rosenii TaxID=1750698 RepID=A0A1S2VI85_9BACT|nr:hypothetical protein [Arsenicibacter rosenii]OIN57955.1 hypothetical protein BLX24_17845 [Arsenicibacter rosenii]